MTGAIPIRTYNTVKEWFDGYLAEVFTRPKEFKWCLEWREHEEAVQVLTTMWLTWEASQAANDPNMDIIWFRDIMYPMMDRLSDPSGTFSSCDWANHKHSRYSMYELNDPPPEV